MTLQLSPAVDKQTLQLPGPLVSTAWLAQQHSHPSLRILDVRSAEHYHEGHLPGAVHVDLAALAADQPGAPAMLLPPTAFAAQMSWAGVGDDSVVVVYDDNWGLPAARVLWALARYGFTQAALLNGGWDQWQAEGRLIAMAPSKPEPAHFTPRPDDSTVATLSWLLAQLADPRVILVDTRGAKEYAEGHLPGARRWDWLNAVPVGSWAAMRPAGELRAELAAQGITPDREIVTYCRSGVRAAHTYWVLRALGYAQVRNYDGSWLEWERTSGAPVERG